MSRTLQEDLVYDSRLGNLQDALEHFKKAKHLSSDSDMHFSRFVVASAFYLAAETAFEIIGGS